MRVLDLCAGELGWSKIFAARGHHCVCVDIKEPKEVPYGCEFIKNDVLDVLWIGTGFRFLCHYPQIRNFDFICVSTPCEEFSTMRNFRPPVPYPAKGIQLFNHARALCEASGLPYVMENVAGAQRYVGRAGAKCGSYFLWGSGVPPLIPAGIRKGMTELAMGLREHKGKPGWDLRHGVKGQTQTALVATIPPELANCVADYAERLLELAPVAVAGAHTREEGRDEQS